LATAEQVAKELELGIRGGAGAAEAVQLGQASCGEVPQTIELCEALPGSFDLGLKVNGHAVIPAA
jgi:hypothetical protein